MKKILATLALTLATLHSEAAFYNIPPGSSITLGNDTISCSGSSQPSSQLYQCLCLDGGSTRQPPPSATAYVRVQDITQLNAAAQRECGRAFYGENSAMWGFGKVARCDRRFE